MNSFTPVLLAAALVSLAACGKSGGPVEDRTPTTTVTETNVDDTTVIVEEEVTAPLTAGDGPAMDSIEETPAPAKDSSRKK